MKKVRIGVFETNSSSTHTLVIVTKEDFEKWKSGELVFDSWEEELVKNEPPNNDEDSDDYQEYYDQHKFYDSRGYDDYNEYYEREYTTPSGDKIVVFGVYGYG